MCSYSFSTLRTHTRTHTQLKGSSECGLKVTQFHFTAWPDHGVPDYATAILAFYQKVKKHHRPSKGPMLVHCRYIFIPHIESTHQTVWCVPLSAGVGRTGTLITIDRALDQIQKEKVVDIAGIIQQLRNQRMKMVQNLVSGCIGEVITITLLV